MERNNETIRLAKKAADAWRDTDTYHQAAQIIDMLISALEGDPTLPQPSNEPLTLDELREMNEEPVWVQNLEEPEKSQWRLLYWDRGKYLVLQGISVRGYLMEEYGESWLAYRRPPEGEADA